MPRPPKPYLERDHYISRAGGEYIKLCHRSEGMARARALLRDHLTRREHEKEHNGGRVLPSLTVSELFVLFLQAVEAEKSRATFLDYQRWCVEFAKLHGQRQFRDVTRFDAQKFKEHLLTATWVRDKHPPRPYKPKSINHAIIALRRAFNWAKTARVPKPFIIGMNEDVEEMLRERLASYGQGERVFTNGDGKPWTKNALVLRMRRLRERAGMRPDGQGEVFVLYTARHTFLTTAGMDPTISDALRVQVANHTDGRTTQLYTHLHEEAIAEAGRRVADTLRGQGTPGK
jgi:site-specific recombinase XerD